VELLLAQAGIDANLEDDEAQTKLRWAIKNGQRAVVELLWTIA
jgi:ankyrin repeat protein